MVLVGTQGESGAAGLPPRILPAPVRSSGDTATLARERGVLALRVRRGSPVCKPYAGPSEAAAPGAGRWRSRGVPSQAISASLQRAALLHAAAFLFEVPEPRGGARLPRRAGGSAWVWGFCRCTALRPLGRAAAGTVLGGWRLAESTLRRGLSCGAPSPPRCCQRTRVWGRAAAAQNCPRPALPHGAVARSRRGLGRGL